MVTIRDNTAIALQTEYDGYTFRSRLEARWAVFFNTLQIPWEYEKEGYDLGAAGHYLPDFWLPSVRFRGTEQPGLWIEIKGVEPDDKETTKAEELVRITHKPLIIFVGLPSPEPSQAVDWPGGHQFAEFTQGCESDELPEVWRDYFMVIEQCHSCEQLYVDFCGRGDNCHVCGGYKDANAPLLNRAYDAAKSARFEYGESGPARRRSRFWSASYCL